MSIITELQKLDNAAADTPRQQWLTFVRSVAAREITDPQTVAAKLKELDKTTGELDSALQRYQVLQERMNRARQLPQLERRSTELGAEVHGFAKQAAELRLQIAQAELAIKTANDCERAARLEQRLTEADRDQAREALARLQDVDSIPQLPADLRDAVASVAHLEAEASESQQLVDHLGQQLARARHASDEWADINASNIEAAAAHRALRAARDNARKTLMETLEG